MDSPRSNTPLILTLLGLGILQQSVYAASGYFVERFTHVPGVMSVHPLGANLVFVLLTGLVNGAFYNGAWLNLLDASRIWARLPMIFLVGLATATSLFLAGHLATALIDHTRSYGSWAQVFGLIITLAAGFRVRDAYAGPNEPPPKV